MKHEASDSVIEEIHLTREKISERFGGSIAAIAEDAARRQSASNRPVWKSKMPNHSLQSSIGVKSCNQALT